MVQQALRGALSDRASEGQIMVVDSWDFDVPSTKAAQTALSALGISGKAMIVLSRGDERAFKSFRNLGEIDIVLSGELAAYDVLCSDSVVFTRQTLPGNSSWTEAPAAVEVKPSRPAAAKSPAAKSPAAKAAKQEPAQQEPAQQETASAGDAPVAEAVHDEVSAPETATPKASAPETEEGA